MPSILAIAAAVILWSPVIMVTRMPPPWHSFTASIASLRGGSIRPTRPSSTSVFGRSAGPRLPAVTPGFSSQASASTRSPCAASLSDSATKRSRSSGAVGPSADCWRSQCSRITSGAPLTRSISLPSADLMQCRHELMFGFERDGVDARAGRLLGRPVHAELGRERIERPLGRVALHFPGASVLKQFRVVAEHRDPPHQREHRRFDRRACRPR